MNLHYIVHRIVSCDVQCSVNSFIQAISIALLQVRYYPDTHKHSRHSTNIVPEFHAEAPQATAS